jgi:hypothetical protein
MSFRCLGSERWFWGVVKWNVFISRSDMSMRNEHGRDSAVAAENSQELCVEGRMRLRSRFNPNICFVGALINIIDTR